MTTTTQTNLEKARRIDAIAKDNILLEVYIYPDGDIFMYDYYYNKSASTLINYHIRGAHDFAQLFIFINHKLIYRD